MANLTVVLTQGQADHDGSAHEFIHVLAPAVEADGIAADPTITLAGPPRDGDRAFTVLALPGRSPGSPGLYDPDARLLIAGDAIYDVGLVDDLDHSARTASRATMPRLPALPVAQVWPGQGSAVDGEPAGLSRPVMPLRRDRPWL